MGEPIPEGGPVTVYWEKVDQDREQPELCRERCGAKLIKNRVIHECIMHRGHIGMWGHHVCNCGIMWIEADLQ